MTNSIFYNSRLFVAEFLFNSPTGMSAKLYFVWTLKDLRKILLKSLESALRKFCVYKYVSYPQNLSYYILRVWLLEHYRYYKNSIPLDSKTEPQSTGFVTHHMTLYHEDRSFIVGLLAHYKLLTWRKTFKNEGPLLLFYTNWNSVLQMLKNIPSSYNMTTNFLTSYKYPRFC